MTKTAYLRVYSPHAEWSREPVPAFVARYGVLSETDGQDYREAVWEGRSVLCPRNLRLRVLESTVAFAGAYRGIGAGLIPEDVARAADRELEVYRRENPGHRSHVLTSPWHVPVRWFVAFDPSDREVYEGPSGPRLRFRTGIGDARSRTGLAYEILRKLEIFSGPTEELGHLSDWLGGFSESSMVELDYADVSDLFQPQDLVFDDSCESIHESVKALAAGDMLRAGELYGKVVTRWAPAFSVTFSN